MRNLLVLLFVTIPCVALANPKVAVAPLDNDDDGTATAVVTELVRSHAQVTSATKVAKAMKQLDTDLTVKASRRKLRTKLDVDLVIYGSVEQDGAKKKITLSFVGSSSPATDNVEVTTKSLEARTFKKRLDTQLAEKIGTAAGDVDATEEESARPARTAKTTKTKKPDEDSDSVGLNGKPSKHAKHVESTESTESTDESTTAETAETERPVHHHTRVAAADDDGNTVSASSDDTSSRRHHSSLLDVPDRNPVTQAGVMIAGGVGGVYRTQQFAELANGTAPSPVGTAAITPEVDAEIYPGAINKGNGGGFGFAVALRQAVGLSVAAPSAPTATESVTEAQYAAGVRYRFVFGHSSLAIGADYVRQRDIANKGALPMGVTINMASTDYSMVGGDATLRLALGHHLGAFASAQGLYALSTGMEATLGSTGAFGVGAAAGADIAVSQRVGLRVQVAADQVTSSFNTSTGPGMTAGVTSSVDRQIDASALVTILY